MSSKILQLLRQKRAEIALREGKELYLIFSNKTLEETARTMPQTLEELQAIKGWGPKKIAQYGTEILEIMQGGDVQHPMSRTDTLPLFEVEDVKHRVSDKNPIPREDMVFSVGEFIETVNNSLSRLGVFRIRGEISRMQLSGSAVYFNLKDPDVDAMISCILWKWKFDKDYNYLEDGMEVIISGVAEVYAKSGRFSIRVEKVEPVGEGALLKAFEALKKKLEGQGYFEEARKRPIPEFIRTIGIITSETGEAINDFRKNIGEYGFNVNLYDVWVEGDYAEKSIVHAIRWFNKNRPDMDVLVLIRGGGGLESFKAFNSEAVADAIVTSRLPILTGIGHERDETIAGYTSDKNLSTPTAVAAFIRTQHENLLMRLESHAENLVYAVETQQNLLLQQVAKIASQLYNGLGRVFDGFRLLERKFSLHMHRYEAKVREDQFRLERLCGRSLAALQERLVFANKRLEVAAASLNPLDPEAILRRGYSIAYRSDGKVIKEASEVKSGDRIQVELYKGRINSRVEDIKS